MNSGILLLQGCSMSFTVNSVFVVAAASGTYNPSGHQASLAVAPVRSLHTLAAVCMCQCMECCQRRIDVKHAWDRAVVNVSFTLATCP